MTVLAVLLYLCPGLAPDAAANAAGPPHAPPMAATAIPAPPDAAYVLSQGMTSVVVSWTGGGPEYRVVYKAGNVAPANESDGTIAYEGPATVTQLTSLANQASYKISIYSKTAGASVFSATAVTIQAGTVMFPTGVRFVSAATGNDAGNTCVTFAAPCRTVTRALAQASPGLPPTITPDTVLVLPGTYDRTLGEVFPITLKPGVSVVSTSGAASTILDAAGDPVRQGILDITGNSSYSYSVEGFTFANGLYQAGQGGVSTGGAVRVRNVAFGTVTLTRNIFRNNEARGYSADGTLGQTGGLGWGGAVYVFSAPVNLTNNQFIGNLARGGDGQSHPGSVLTSNEAGGQALGGAIYFAGSGNVVNNTFHSNRAIGGNGGLASNGRGNGGDATAGALWAGGNPAPVISNNIFAWSNAQGGMGGTVGPASAGAVTQASAPSSTANLFWGNVANGTSNHGTTGTKAILFDAQFHAEPDNLRIRPGSPAAAAAVAAEPGTPGVDFNRSARPVGPAVGAFEPSAVAGPSADLSVVEAVTPSPARTDKDVVIALTVANAGPNVAPGVVLTDLLPPGTTFIYAPPGCVHRAGNVSCPLGTLAAGASVTVRLVVRPLIATASPAFHRLRNIAFASGAVNDASTANNVSTQFAFAIDVNASPAGTQVQRYRLFSPVTSEHLYTTDLNEYNTLGSFVGSWVQEGPVGRVLNNPGVFNGVVATPYYRLYNTANAQHHWTTDPNEYYTLVLFPQYSGEGVDGYIFPTQAPGTIPLYRLLYPFSVPVAGLHHWTIDANEYNALIASFGWVGEGGSGFVIP